MIYEISEKIIWEKIRQDEEHKPLHPLQALIEQFGGVAFEKQIVLDDIVDNKPWQIDMEKQQIVFGDDLYLSFQLLGTYSYSTKTWLWAWANDKSDLPESIIQQALELKKYGEDNGIELFTHCNLNAGQGDLHIMGLIASGIFNASGYYIADYGEGSLMLTFSDEHIEQTYQKNSTHLQILSVFQQFISTYEMNHYFVLKHYLLAKDYQVTFDDGLKLIATKDQCQISAEFYNLLRLIELNG